MPWLLKFSDRDATCHGCTETIGAFDARADYERADFETPEGQQAGWRTLRFCLPCAVPLIDADATEVSQRAREIRAIWNNTRKRMGRDPLKPPKSLNGRTKTCTVKSCSAEAVETLMKRGCGKLFVCTVGHFWIE